jgi:hypothetical protein
VHLRVESSVAASGTKVPLGDPGRIRDHPRSVGGRHYDESIRQRHRESLEALSVQTTDG